MRYRRANIPGATYFFTLNAVDRQRQVLLDNIELLRDSFKHVRARHPFLIDAIVVLPEHLHMLMTLPPADADFPTRIMLINQEFSRGVPRGEDVSKSRVERGERGIWQRRSWAHRIRDEEDFARHVDYIHFNPVKHGWVSRAADWPHSSLHRHVRQGCCRRIGVRRLARRLE